LWDVDQDSILTKICIGDCDGVNTRLRDGQILRNTAIRPKEIIRRISNLETQIQCSGFPKTEDWRRNNT